MLIKTYILRNKNNILCLKKKTIFYLLYRNLTYNSKIPNRIKLKKPFFYKKTTNLFYFTKTYRISFELSSFIY